MSKGSLKKFRKNDYNDDEDNYGHAISNYANKKREKRMNHALRTKNIDELLEAEDEDFDHDWQEEYQ